MTDPVADAARAAAVILAQTFGVGLIAEVDAALAARAAAANAGKSRIARKRPEGYIDPISLGSLIVSISGLAWTVYTDLRDRHPSPPPDAVTHETQIKFRKQDMDLPEGGEHIIEIVATEITRHSSPPQ